MKLYKNIYKIVFLLYLIFTIIEILMFLFNQTNYYGVYYLLINMLIIFSLLIININYKKANKKIRLSKNITNFILQIFSSYFLLNILINTYKYIDYSSKYISHIFITSKILKPIILLILIILNILDLYKIDITNYKIYKHNK